MLRPFSIQSNEYQDSARYYFGEIAFKEGGLEGALSQWERLGQEYPQNRYMETIAQKIVIASEILTQEEDVRIEDLSVKALFDNTWSPTWKNGKRLEVLSGKAVQIEVQLNSARLYAIRGDFVQMLGEQSRRFREGGVIPEARIGV